MNRVEISGRLTRDPEIRYLGASRFPIMELNVAVEDAEGRWNSESRKTEVGSGFYKVEVKGEYAEGLAVTLQKGDEVYVVGSLTQFRLEAREGKEGQTKTSVAAKFVQPLKISANSPLSTFEQPLRQEPLPPIPRDEEPF